jgi:AcrR family transcriptional regulator
MQEVADAAGVSKALVHYHFRDRATLLGRLVEHAAEGVVARERAAAARAAAAPAAQTLDVFWGWLDGEIARGELRALVELATEPAARVREAGRYAARARRASAAATLETLFAALALRPRVPSAMLAEVLVAFVDGLVLGAELLPGQQRVAYDVFWLALLSLAE